MNSTLLPNLSPAMFHDDDDTAGILSALACLDDESLSQPRTDVSKDVSASVMTDLACISESEDELDHSQSGSPCAPYFFYKDFSAMPDPNPNIPVTAPGRIPNFPAKMFAILSRPDLSDIVSWMPHGRSWKVHKPREFEIKVIPMYFEHSKFSSFIRQANGWGFRRMISKGPDRNSYYHELFLRGLPHLLKIMKRPAPNCKPLADASTEPDFYRISDMSPLPESKNNFLEVFEKEAHRGVSVNYADETKSLLFMSELLSESKLPSHNTANPSMPKYSFDLATVEPLSVFPQRQLEHSINANVVPSGSVCLPPIQEKIFQQSFPVQTMSVHHVPMVSQPVSVEKIAPAPWYDNCFSHEEESQGFEDPFAGGLRPIDFF